MSRKNKIKFFLFCSFLLLAANFYLWQFIFSLGNSLKVVFFNVGQGDSIFVETSRKYQILIDGGPSGEIILEKLAEQLPFWDRTIDLVILTHPDYDHLRGLLDVLDRYRVENILWTGVLKETGTFEKWLEKLKKEKTNIVIAEAGQIIKAGLARFYILHPFENLEGQLFEKSSNDTSIVAELIFGRNTFLFPGDITKKVERKLISENSYLDSPAIILQSKAGVNEYKLASQTLKVAHHGSKNASSREFLEEVSPEIAVISCGKDNSFGHPEQEVLSNLGEFGIKVLRTDRDDDIKFQCSDIRCQRMSE